jgi:hypothetical protein
VALEVVGDFGLQVVARLGPLFEEGVEFFELDKEMLGGAHFRTSAAMGADRVDQVGGGVGCAAFVAVVAILIGRAALGAGSLDEAVGEEGAGDGVVKLTDVALDDQAGGLQLFPEGAAQLAVFGAVGAAVVVELDLKPGEVAAVLVAGDGDEFFFGDAGFTSRDHDRGAVGVVGADVDTVLALQLLEADPDIGLDVLHEVADMDRPVGVGQRRGHQDAGRRRGGGVSHEGGPGGGGDV